MTELIIEHASLKIYGGDAEIFGKITKGANGIYTFLHRSLKFFCQFRLKKTEQGWTRYLESNIVYPQDYIDQIGIQIDAYQPGFQED